MLGSVLGVGVAWLAPPVVQHVQRQPCSDRSSSRRATSPRSLRSACSAPAGRAAAGLDARRAGRGRDPRRTPRRDQTAALVTGARRPAAGSGHRRGGVGAAAAEGGETSSPAPRSWPCSAWSCSPRSCSACSAGRPAAAAAGAVRRARRGTAPQPHGPRRGRGRRHGRRRRRARDRRHERRRPEPGDVHADCADGCGRDPAYGIDGATAWQAFATALVHRELPGARRPRSSSGCSTTRRDGNCVPGLRVEPESAALGTDQLGGSGVLSARASARCGCPPTDDAGRAPPWPVATWSC